MRKMLLGAAACMVLIPAVAVADSGRGKHDGDDRGRGAKGLQADPFVFVGRSSQCGGPPGGSNIVTSAWLEGMGLPDSGAPNSPDASSRRDPHDGLLLNKNGATTDCSSAGAEIEGLRRSTTLTELGFDYRDGTHCNNGAPRFNITSTAGDTYFAGCARGAQSDAPQDPDDWTRIRFDFDEGSVDVSPANPGALPFAFGPNGTRVKSIVIIYDEGTDQPGLTDPAGVGLAVIDNININGKLIRRGDGIEPDGDKRGRGRGRGHHDD